MQRPIFQIKSENPQDLIPVVEFFDMEFGRENLAAPRVFVRFGLVKTLVFIGLVNIHPFKSSIVMY